MCGVPPSPQRPFRQSLPLRANPQQSNGTIWTYCLRLRRWWGRRRRGRLSASRGSLLGLLNRREVLSADRMPPVRRTNRAEAGAVQILVDIHLHAAWATHDMDDRRFYRDPAGGVARFRLVHSLHGLASRTRAARHAASPPGPAISRGTAATASVTVAMIWANHAHRGISSAPIWQRCWKGWVNPPTLSHSIISNNTSSSSHLTRWRYRSIC